MTLLDFGALVDYAMANNKLKNLVAEGWNWGLMDSSKTLGLCKAKAKMLNFSKLAIQHFNKEDLLDLIYHEVAHAIDGNKHGHGKQWKQIFLYIYPNANTNTTRNLNEFDLEKTVKMFKYFVIERKENKIIVCGSFVRKPPKVLKLLKLPANQHLKFITSDVLKEMMTDPTIEIIVD